MELSTPQRSGGGCIILLDVPPGSSITIDGITRLTPSASSLPNNQNESTSPNNSGVLIISGIPNNSTSSSSTLQDQFHLLIVRCGATHNKHNQRECDIRTLPVGFMLTSSSSTNNNHKNTELGYDWIFARRYDPLTEEISNQPVDDLTLNNLLLAMRSGGELSSTTTAALAGAGGMLGRNIVMTYDQFMQSTSSRSGGGNRRVSISSWDARTTCINSTYLQRRHAVTHEDKIVPSSYDQEEQAGGTSNDKISSTQAQQTIDGKQISYPQIPCIDPSINARRLMQHAGTRLYLSKLSPEIRTKLLLGSDDSFHAGGYVWNDILSCVYDNSSSSGNFSDFLADVQLSFLMFLFLECHTSLEHWRDAISMCSLAVIPTGDNKNNLLQTHASFFQQLLSIIHDQFMCIETEFFQEVEYSSGQRNFLIQALERLCGACDDIAEGEQSDIDGLKLASSKLKRMLRDRFELSLTSSSSNKDADMEMEEECPPIVYEGNKAPVSSERTHGLMEQEYNDDEEDEDDGPVIVPYDEFESSISRSAAMLNTTHKQVNDDPVEAKHRTSYPLLFAAMAPQEDVVMCAARCLDEQRDVSLVREAAAYLEEVEASRCSS